MTLLEKISFAKLHFRPIMIQVVYEYECYACGEHIGKDYINYHAARCEKMDEETRIKFLHNEALPIYHAYYG